MFGRNTASLGRVQKLLLHFKCRIRLEYCVPRSEWDKVWSRLSSHLQPFFLAHSAYFNNFRQKIPYFDASRQKRVLFNCFATKQCLGMLKMWGKPLFCLSLVLYGSLWLPALSHRNTSNHPRGTWFADFLAMKTRLWRDDVGVLEEYLYTQVIQIAAMGAPSVKNWLHSCFFRPPAICWI